MSALCQFLQLVQVLFIIFNLIFARYFVNVQLENLFIYSFIYKVVWQHVFSHGGIFSYYNIASFLDSVPVKLFF